ncbi:MAG TPA: flagellar hook-associated protein FlgL [Acidobacteriaceae bacterium]
MRFNATFGSTITTDIQQSEQALQTALQQVSTGKRVNLPSDDPAASAALVQSLNQSANVDQYTANATAASSQAQSGDSVLSSVVSLLNKAITLGTEGANGTTSAADRASIASQVNGLLASVASEANTTYQGVALFGGTANSGPAFVADAASPDGYTYAGNTGINYIAVGDTLKVQVNVPGSQIFTQPGASALGSLQQLATALTSGTTAQIGAATAAVTSALSYVSEQHAVYGNAVNQFASQEDFLSQESVTLKSQQTSLVGIDTATAAETLAQAEAQNSELLAAAAKVLPTTLLDYLK